MSDPNDQRDDTTPATPPVRHELHDDRDDTTESKRTAQMLACGGGIDHSPGECD